MGGKGIAPFEVRERIKKRGLTEGRVFSGMTPIIAGSCTLAYVYTYYMLEGGWTELLTENRGMNYGNTAHLMLSRQSLTAFKRRRGGDGNQGGIGGERFPL